MEEWLVHLEKGDPERAWDLFLSRYRRLIFATIRHHAHDGDAFADLFVDVCEALRENELARLRRFRDPGLHGAQLSTWLVIVVRNLVIDRLRVVHGRRRVPVRAERLTSLQRRIFERVIVQGWRHREAYEQLRTSESGLSFGGFLRELATVYRAGRSWGAAPTAWRALPGPWVLPLPPDTAVEEAERRTVLEEALAALPAEDAAAVRLYVLEGLSATEVARIVDLPNAKSVYNHVYRALAVMRRRLEVSGYLQPGDL